MADLTSRLEFVPLDELTTPRDGRTVVDSWWVPGDRVYVTDPGLAELRAIMRRFCHTPLPNHHGTVQETESWVRDGEVLIWFDNEDGPGLGQGVPYPAREVWPLPEPGSPVYKLWPWQKETDDA